VSEPLLLVGLFEPPPPQPQTKAAADTIMAEVILLNRIIYSPYQHKNMLILIFITQEQQSHLPPVIHS
jgi:hypothetical protein